MKFCFVQIYVPIVDEGGHWCLMVVHIVERKIYLLDSHLVAEKVEERHRMLKQIVSAHVM
jgi:Ulp1 family protease